jgi:periplasmic divalent cation tolerance protein
VTGIVSVYVVFGTDEEARRIGRQLVEERLAACVNILGACQSIYRWEGKIEEADEVAVIFKTAADKADALISRLTELHSYAVPAATAWAVWDTPEPYREWVINSTR